MSSTAAAMTTCGVCLTDLPESDPLLTSTFASPCSHTFHRACTASGAAPPGTAPAPPPICRHCLHPFDDRITITIVSSTPSDRINRNLFETKPTTCNTPSYGFYDNIPITYDDDADEPIPDAAQSSAPPPPQTATIAVTAYPEYPAVAASAAASNFVVLLKLRAPPSAPADGDRAPVDLVVVLDVSGSMEGHKLALVKTAVRFIVDALGPTDRLSIITFATNADRLLPLSLMSPGGRARAAAVVNSLAAEGSTNIKAGLRAGVGVLDDRRHKNPVAGLILLSDGEDTDNYVGNSYRDLLPVPAPPIHTFGFGADHDPAAMNAIADASGGTFSFIEAEEAIQDAFAMCIGGLMSVIAQRVEVLATAATPGVQISLVDSGSYPVKILNHGLAAGLDVGDLYAEEEKDFLFHIAVPVSNGAPATPLLSFMCSYKTPLAGEVMHVNAETAVVRRPELVSPEDGEPNLVVDGQRNRIMVANSIKEAQEKAESGDMEGARAVLAARRAVVVESASAKAGDALCRWLDTEMREIERRMASVRVYRRSGRAYAMSGLRSHMQQRATAGAHAMKVEAFMKSSVQSLGRSGGGAPPPPSCGVVGYQTRAMRSMVKKSRDHARQSQDSAQSPGRSGGGEIPAPPPPPTPPATPPPPPPTQPPPQSTNGMIIGDQTQSTRNTVKKSQKHARKPWT